MLDTAILDQVKQLFSNLKSEFTLLVMGVNENVNRSELIEFLNDFASASDKLSVQDSGDSSASLKFTIIKDGKSTGIHFQGIPTGHEFTSLLLAILNADGIGKNIPDEGVQARIKALKGAIDIRTYVSLTCTNCPDIIQALNMMATLNDKLSNTMVDGSWCEEETKKLNINAVPTVVADGQVIHVGRGDLATLLNKLEDKYGVEQSEISTAVKCYDVVVLGAGPAGSTAAIYSVRKGLKVAVVAERVGGQVNETVSIENLISVPQITGSELAMNLSHHMCEYPIDIFDSRTIKSVENTDGTSVVTATSGERFSTRALIVASGASWRKLNVPGEKEYTGAGVAYCAHCDGPFFKGKRIAVVGGGNSGLEAAIDLSGICEHVTVIEFLETLKADQVLQDKVAATPNIDVILNTQTTEIVGDGKKVVAVKYKNRSAETETQKELDGVFVQIGLVSNSSAVKELVETNRAGEIIIDEKCRTSHKGIYAAGDCTNVPYKQIVIAMGEGAKAALSAFDDKIRGEI